MITWRPSRLDQLVAFNPVDTAVLGHWTKRGLKLTARAAPDFGFPLPGDLKGPEDLRIHAEAAVLGWENQPFSCEKRSERMPMMLGLNQPTLRLPDLLILQVVYYKSPSNDIGYFNSQSIPISRGRTTWANGPGIGIRSP